MDFLKWLQLLELIMKILDRLNDKGKEVVVKTIADKINEVGK